jgi:hypothetical protein
MRGYPGSPKSPGGPRTTVAPGDRVRPSRLSRPIPADCPPPPLGPGAHPDRVALLPGAAQGLLPGPTQPVPILGLRGLLLGVPSPGEDAD